MLEPSDTDIQSSPEDVQSYINDLNDEIDRLEKEAKILERKALKTAWVNDTEETKVITIDVKISNEQKDALMDVLRQFEGE